MDLLIQAWSFVQKEIPNATLVLTLDLMILEDTTLMNDFCQLC